MDEDEDEVLEELGLEDADEIEEQDARVAPLKPPSTRSKASPKGKAPAAAKPASKAKTSAKTKTTARGKGKGKASPARTKKAPAATTRSRTTRGKKPALFLTSDDESEDEVGGGEVDEIDEIDEVDESAGVVATELGAGEEEAEVRGTAYDDERVDAGMTSTLRSTAGTQSRREAMRAAKKRAAAALGGADDDSDDAVFKGFGSRKRGRVR